MIEIIQRHIIPAAYALLPAPMASPAATAMLLAIGLQESQFLHRQQIGGPAHGFFQFERGGGIKGVQTHPKTQGPLLTAMTQLRYEASMSSTSALHAAVEHNDVAACVFARLLLWTLPAKLPGREDAGAAYGQYIAAWRPGRPHPSTWASYFVEAWHRVDQLSGEDI